MKPRCNDETCCLQCGDRLIHQGARRGNESGSPFGQWVHDELPRTFTVGDVDLYVRRWYRDGGEEVVLLRWIEHKSTGQKFEDAQQRALIDFDAIIRHAIDCPTSPVALDKGSGVFVVRSGFEDGLPVHVFIERVSLSGRWERSAELDAEHLGQWLPRGQGRREVA